MESRTLRTAQIHFIDTPISLIHIPLHSYSHYVQPIIQCLCPLDDGSESEKRPVNGRLSPPPPASPWTNQHAFLNLSITPVECSLFCSKALADKYFAPAIATECRKASAAKGSTDHVSISREDFIAMSVEGEGLEAGQRVLELTTPLAMAGVSVFFVTTYFSDYLLVPSKSRGKVMRALEERGFAFDRRNGAHHRMTSSSSSSGSYMSPVSSSHSHHHHHHNHHNHHNHPSSPPHSPTSTSPPPSSIGALQATTIALLKQRHIFPKVHSSVRLLQCAGRSDPLSPGSPNSASSSSELLLGLLKCLAHPPQFLSLTLTATEPASFLLEEAVAKARFAGPQSGSGGEGYSYLMGSRDSVLVPILLDLGRLPLEATGIVCGIASKLVGGGGGAAKAAGDDYPQGERRRRRPLRHSNSNGGAAVDSEGEEEEVEEEDADDADEDDDDDDKDEDEIRRRTEAPIEMSYLSTARGAAVLVDEADLERAVEALKAGEDGLELE